MALSSRMKSICLGLMGVLSLCLAVDRGNFKTCEESSFCKRQRRTEQGKSPYVIVMDSPHIESSKFSVELHNTQSDVRLKLEISALKGNMARLRIQEMNPVRPRYEPPIGDVLVKEPEGDLLEVEQDEYGGSGATMTFQNNKIILQSNPFRLDFLVDNEPVISVNSLGLLNWENQQRRPQPPAAEEQPEAEPIPEDQQEQGEEHEEQAEDGEPEEPSHQEDKQEEKKPEHEEEPGMWEETFKTHHDSKPHGPTSVGLDISFPGFEFVYGIPEHADTLALKTTKNTDPYRLYNLDVFEYELYNPMALYGSVPVMLAHNEKRTVGMFWLNAAETWIDISSNTADKGTFSKLVDFVAGGDDIPQVDTHWFSESGIIDVFIMMGPKPNDVFSAYAKLTGTTELPPLFGIAYHQSRWNYNDEQDVAKVDAGFDQHNIPLDVIWLDIEHTDGKRYFTWDNNKFPNPEDMITNVSAKGRKMVTIIDPHIKRDDGYYIHKDGTNLGHYVKNKDNVDYDGWCWPGSSSWLDFVAPEVRKFWATNFLTSNYKGSTLDLFVWNDMNEPSVFNGPEITMHKDAKHFGGWEHRDVHNLYGMYVHQATTEGLMLRSENRERPFVLSRAFFAGSQRYGAVWTGDNMGEWGHLKISLPMIMTLNLVGITFSGADVGGFFKNPEPELLTRWYQAAAYQPFFRAHAHLDTRRREPWLMPQENLEAIRQAIRARYRLLPYWYTLFYLGEKDGGPVMKPLWVDFPTDKSTFGIENQHLIGSALLVHPVTDPGASGVSVYFPGTNEVWYDTDTYKSYQGGVNSYIAVDLNKIPVFHRGGYIIPRKERIRRSSSLTSRDPYTFVVALNKQGTAKGQLYIDDYHSFQYKIGQFAFTEFIFANKQLVNKNSDESQIYKTSSWLERVIVVGLDQQPTSIQVKRKGEGANQLDFTYTPENKVLVIRKPAVNIAEDWTISIQ